HPGALNYGKTFDVAAVDVVGSMSAATERDVYSFTGKAGDLMNLEVVSDAVLRPIGIYNPINASIEVVDAAGNRVAYYNSADAQTNAEFESVAAQPLDLRLPADGTYYIRVTTEAVNDQGEAISFSPDPATYELFLYRFATANVATGGDVLDGQAGDDTLRPVS